MNVWFPERWSQGGESRKQGDSLNLLWNTVAKGRNNKMYIRIWVQTPFKTLLPQPPENKGTDASFYLISMNQYSKRGLILMYSELGIWRGQNKTNWLTRAEASLEAGETIWDFFIPVRVNIFLLDPQGTSSYF